jgi:hypothetical protein
LWSNGVAAVKEATETTVASRTFKELGFIVADCDAPGGIRPGSVHPCL